MNEVVTINGNFEDMAKAMGMTGASGTDVTKKSVSSLARLRINHTPIMGTTEINGKSVNIEQIPSGSYKIEIPDSGTYYQSDLEIRPFMQRYMYKRFIKGSDDSPNRYVKTVMADNLDVDLKDNDGGHNCGKPAGYIQDFNSLPDKQKELIRQIKRVRVVFGLAKFDKAMQMDGDVAVPSDLGHVPFIWEVENREGFKTVGEVFKKLGNMKRLPVNHLIHASSEERKLPNGNTYYVPSTKLDLSSKIETSDEDQELFGNLLAWVTNYNQYIMSQWNENVHNHENVDASMVESFIDITSEEKVQ